MRQISSPPPSRAILGQAHRPLQVVVVDDGSYDDTAEVAKHAGPEIDVVRQTNRGPSAARNAGIRTGSRASSWRSSMPTTLGARGWLKTALDRFATDDDLDVVLGRVRYVGLSGRERAQYRFENEQPIAHIPHMAAAVYRRKRIRPCWACSTKRCGTTRTTTGFCAPERQTCE